MAMLTLTTTRILTNYENGLGICSGSDEWWGDGGDGDVKPQGQGYDCKTNRYEQLGYRKVKVWWTTFALWILTVLNCKS